MLYPATTEAATVLIETLVRASLSGGLLIVFVWSVTRLVPRLPASVRFALWWIAGSKLLVSLALPVALSVSVVVPSRLAARVPAFALRRAAVPSAMPSRRATSAAMPAAPDENADPESTTPSPSIGGAATAPVPPVASVTWPEAVAVLYFAGVVAFTGRCLRDAMRLRGLLRFCRPPAADHVLWNEVASASAALGVSRCSPRVLLAPGAAGPFVAALLGGMSRAVVVVPAGFAEQLSAPERHMALVHEIAHIRRRDLWLAAVPALARVLFWFHPLVYVLCRETEAAREEACDVLALAATASAPAPYGRLLVAVALRQVGRSPALESLALPMAAAASPGFCRLRRRLRALERAAAPCSRLARFAGSILTLLSVGSLLPWRVMAEAVTAPAGEPGAMALAGGLAKSYEIIHLGTLGGAQSDAYAVTEDGIVTGSANVYPLGQRGHAFVWSDGRMTELAAPGRLRHAVGMAASGTSPRVAGWAYNRSAHPVAFIASGPTGRTRVLPVTAGWRWAQAAGIDDSGNVVGDLRTGGKDQGAVKMRAVVWSGDGGRPPLSVGTLGGPYSHAAAISPTGFVVGKADLPRERGGTGPTHAFRARLGASEAPEDLGVLPGGVNSAAYGVSRAGTVVGFSEAGASRAPRAFIAAAGADGVRDLGGLDPQEGQSVAYAVNDTGMAVGMATVPGATDAADTHAVLWLDKDNSTSVTDLNDLLPPGSGWVLRRARGINNRGWIVGQGVVNGKLRAFLLRPRG